MLSAPKNLKLAFLLILTPVVLAFGCGDQTGSGPFAVQDGGAAPVVGPFPAPRIAPELDSGQAVSALIGPAGGTIEATGSDGARFTLELPPGALDSEQSISLTPIRSIPDMPFATSFTAGAALGPDGLRLLVPGKLTIDRPEGFVPGSSLGFGFLGQGEEFHLKTFDLDGSRVSYALFHFSGYGDMTGAEVDALDAMIQATYTEAETAAQNQIAAIVAQAVRANAGLDEMLDRVEEVFRDYFVETVLPDLVAADTTNEESKILAAIQKGLTWWQMLEMESRRLGGRVNGDPILNSRERTRLKELVRAASFQATEIIKRRMEQKNDIQVALDVLKYESFLDNLGIPEDLMSLLGIKINLSIEAPETVGEFELVDIVVRATVALGSNPPRSDIPVQVDLTLQGAQPSSDSGVIQGGQPMQVSAGLAPGSTRIKIEAHAFLDSSTGALTRIESEAVEKTVEGAVTFTMPRRTVFTGSPLALTATLKQGRGLRSGAVVSFEHLDEPFVMASLDPVSVATDQNGMATTQYLVISNPEGRNFTEVEASVTIGGREFRDFTVIDVRQR